MGIKVGDQLKDNDPRSSHRVLTITSLGMVTENGPQSVRGKGRAGPEVSIAVRRIHCDGKARRSGFDLVPTDPPALMQYVGREVILVRGSRGRLEGAGRERRLRARLDKVEHVNVYATLLEDDPEATVAPFKAGESGIWHGHSFVEIGCEVNTELDSQTKGRPLEVDSGVRDTQSQGQRGDELNQEDSQLLVHLQALGYTGLCEKPGVGLCGLMQFMFTGGLVIGLGPRSYKGRYCYETMLEAQLCLEAWDGKGDPPGRWIKYKGAGQEERLGPGATE